MYGLENISVYIFNWKKVSANSRVLYDRISPIIQNTTIINCDENLHLDSSIPHVQLDDSHYYGSQYKTAINHVKEGKIFCVIVGDNIPDTNFKQLFERAVHTFNTSNVGVFAPNDKRSSHQHKGAHYRDNLYDTANTDCGFWFIHPTLVQRLKPLNYAVTNYGWGIDVITLQEARKKGMLVLRDYTNETDQLDHSCGYPHAKAQRQMAELVKLYQQLQ